MTDKFPRIHAETAPVPDGACKHFQQAPRVDDGGLVEQFSAVFTQTETGSPWSDTTAAPFALGSGKSAQGWLSRLDLQNDHALDAITLARLKEQKLKVEFSVEISLDNSGAQSKVRKVDL